MPRLSTILAIGLTLVAGLGAQSGNPAAKFQAADIYLRPHGTGGLPSMTAGMLRGERYDFRNATMLDLIKGAYGIEKTSVVGGPNWLDWNRFDIVAKAAPGTAQETVAEMLQSLLAERFMLAVHRDTRQVPGYALVTGEGRPKLKPAASEAAGGCDTLPNQQSGTALLAGMTCHGITLEAFAPLLRGRAGAYVTGEIVDATGLSGRWDFDVRWTPRALLAAGGADAVSLTKAIEEQLGLKLAARPVPAAVLVVDRVNEKPAPNPSGAALDFPAPPPAEFDVADIKISPPDAPTSGRLQPGVRLDLAGMTMKTLIRLAWNLSDDELLAGGPKWLDDTKYTLVAKSTTAIAGTAGAMQIDIDDLRLMLRALLVDRFKLKTHFEDRPVSAYTLVADKPKLTAADPVNRTNCREGVAPGVKDPRDANPILARLVTCQNMTMGQFAEDLTRIAGGYIHVPVIDATGITGAFDFMLNFSPAGRVGGAGPAGETTAGAVPVASEPTGALSLFDALQRQLGLKLEMRKRALPVLVIEHVEQQPD